MPENQNVGYGAMIREARHEAGRSLEDVSGEVGCTLAYLSRVEREVASPGRKLCLRLSEELDLDKDELLGMVGHVAPDVIQIIASDPALAKELRERALKR